MVHFPTQNLDNISQLAIQGIAAKDKDNSLLEDNAQHIFDISALTLASDLGQHICCKAQVLSGRDDINLTVDGGELALGGGGLGKEVVEMMEAFL